MRLNAEFDPTIPETFVSNRVVKDMVGGTNHKPVVGDAGIHLEFRTNKFLGTREMGKKILSFLIQTGDVFVPELFDGGKLTNGRKVRFDPSDFSLALDGWVDDRYSLGIIAERHDPIEVSIVVSASDFLMFDHFGLSIGSAWFTSSERVSRFLSVANDLYSITEANNGYIQNWRSERVVGEITDKNGNITGYDPPRTKWLLKGLFWANFFGPEYVRMFGRERLLSAPWHKIQNLSDGGLLLLISESPVDAAKPEYESFKQEIYEHLGMDAFTGTLLPEFRTDGRKKRDARPLIQSGGIRDDVFG